MASPSFRVQDARKILTPDGPASRVKTIVDRPAGAAQELGDLAIAVAAIPLGQRDNVGGQSLFVVTAPRDLALRRAVLSQCRTGTALGNRQHGANILNTCAATRGA